MDSSLIKQINYNRHHLDSMSSNEEFFMDAAGNFVDKDQT